MKFMEFLQGKKTYLCAAAGGVTVFLMWSGFLEMSVGNMILAALGFGGLASLRASK